MKSANGGLNFLAISNVCTAEPFPAPTTIFQTIAGFDTLANSIILG